MPRCSGKVYGQAYQYHKKWIRLIYLSSDKKLHQQVEDTKQLEWTYIFRWFEGEKSQYRFVPYDWAFLFLYLTLQVVLFAN